MAKIYQDISAQIEEGIEDVVGDVDVQRRAALNACAHAETVAEAREFLDMLGLTEPLLEEEA